MREEILSLAKDYEEYTVRMYRKFHSCPEISGEEYKTAEMIRAELDEMGIAWRAIGTGTVAEIATGRDGAVTVLRADIDALPITERNEFEHASKNPGLMHACGHDSHIAMLLGAARILTSVKAELPGPVRLIFQPSEERNAGANWMIDGGAMQGAGSVYCLHAGPGIPVGKLVTKPGVIHASSDGIRITVYGESAHGSAPHMGVDAIVIASHIVLALQDLISRETSAWEQAVLTIGAFHGGTARNIVCDKVVMDATLRTLNEDVRQMLHRRIEEVAKGTTAMMRGRAEMEFVQKYCSNINDAHLTERAVSIAKAYFGEKGVSELEKPAMEGEDFGFYQRLVPGVKLYIGTGCENRLHTDRFHIDEDMLKTGAAFMAAICVEK